MISQTTEYALRAIMWLAGNSGESVGTAEIAEAIEVPAGYMSKVLQTLARAGLVISQPGRNGGFQLTRKPAELSVLDVVNAIDPIRHIEECPLGREAHEDLCPLHRRLDEANRLVEKSFSESTIAELLESAPGCEALTVPAERGGN